MVALGLIVATIGLGASGAPYWAIGCTGVALAVLIVDQNARASRVRRGGVVWSQPFRQRLRAATYCVCQGCMAAMIAYAGGRVIGVAVAGG